MRDCVVSAGDYYDETNCNPSCQELYGDPREACFEAYGEDCARLLRCVRGDPEAPAPCTDGEVNALGTGRCVALCRPASHPHGEVACAEGECMPWHGAYVCGP